MRIGIESSVTSALGLQVPCTRAGSDFTALFEALNDNGRMLLKSLTRGIRKNPNSWSARQTKPMHWWQFGALKCGACAVAQGGAMRSVMQRLRRTTTGNSPGKVGRVDVVVRAMLANRSKAYVQAMSGLLQQAKRAASGFCNVSCFISIAALRMTKLERLTVNVLLPVLPQSNVPFHRCL